MHLSGIIISDYDLSVKLAGEERLLILEQNTPPELITKAEYQRLAAFRYAIRKFVRFSEQASRGAGLTPQQHQALLAIKGQSNDERATISDLAEWMQLEHHTVVELVDRMVASGLVSREPNPKDRREVLVSLTPRGEDVLARLSKVTRDQLRRLAPTMQAMLRTLEESDGVSQDSSANDEHD